MARPCGLPRLESSDAKAQKVRTFGFYAKTYRVLVSAQNLRPATDAEALAHQVLNEEPVIPDAIARGNQEFEDHRGILAETPVEEPLVEKEDPLDVPLASIMEEEETPSEPIQIALKVRKAVCVRGRESRVEPEAERPPSRRISSYDITDDLPAQIRSQLADARAAQFGDLTGAMSTMDGLQGVHGQPCSNQRTG